MKTGYLRRGLITALIYLTVITGIVVLQFSSPSGLFWKSGLASARTHANRVQPGTPERLEISLGGLLLSVSPDQPAIAFTREGWTGKVAPVSATTTKKGFSLGLSGDLVLLLERPRPEVEAWQLSLSGPDPKIAGLRISYKLAGGSRLEVSETSVILATEGKKLRISVPGAAFDGETVSIPLGQALLAQIVETKPETKPLLAARTDLDFRQDILGWMDKAWSGLSQSRLDASSLTWKQAGADPAFSERALVAWLAEAFRRGQGAPVLSTARRVRELYPQRLGVLSVPYFGNLQAVMGASEAKDQTEAERLATLVHAAAPALLETPDLLLRLIDRCPSGFYSEALRFVGGLDPESLSPAQFVGLLAAAADSEQYVRGATDSLPNHASAETRAASLAQSTGSGHYLVFPGQDSVDIALSLRAGLALVALGKAEARDDILALGQALVEGFLALTDPEGFAPAAVVIRDGAVAERSGTIAPETVYPMLAANPYYPHEVSFAKDVEPGVWAWTSAPTLAVEGGTGRRTFSATFPEGLSHYLVIYGVRPFANIRLYGIDYSQDPQFESYNASGYSYKGSARALYLKMRHKTEVEKVELIF